MAQLTGGTQFSRGLRTGITMLAFVLPIVIFGMLIALFHIAASYGNPRPDNWFRLELLETIIKDSLLPLIGIWLLSCLIWRFAARVPLASLIVPVLLVALVVQEYPVYLRGLDRVRACEALIVLC